jgi:hypothetical protein
VLASLLLLLQVVSPITLGAVSLDAPHPERYSAHIGLAPGEPYDAEAVREAVLRLMATGDFEDVVVEAATAEGGVALAFRTRPAPRLQGIRVQGDRTLSEARVRRDARLRSLEPLWPKRLAAVADDAQRALRSDGWLDAQLEASAQPVEGGALLVVEAALGPRVRMRFARVDAVPKALVMDDLVRPVHGDVYRRERAEEAAERMRQRLAAAGYWRAVVEPVSPRCVIPIHWDDFTLPLFAPLEPSPRLLDDVPASMAFLIRKTAGGAPGLGMLPEWKPVTLLGAGAAACGGTGKGVPHAS